MNTKIKTIIAVTVIFVLTAIYLTFYLKKQDTSQSILDSRKKQFDILQKEQLKELEGQLKEEQNMNTTTIKGSVVKINEKFITIKNANAINDIMFNEKITVFALNEGLAEMKKIEDLEDGTDVNIEVSTKDSTAVSIEILN